MGGSSREERLKRETEAIDETEEREKDEDASWADGSRLP